jgi:hypothetical protein
VLSFFIAQPKQVSVMQIDSPRRRSARLQTFTLVNILAFTVLKPAHADQRLRADNTVGRSRQAKAW